MRTPWKPVGDCQIQFFSQAYFIPLSSLSLSPMISAVSGVSIYGNGCCIFPPCTTLTPPPPLPPLLCLNFTCPLTLLNVKRHSPSISRDGWVLRMVRPRNVDGLILTKPPPAPRRWGLVHGATPLMTISGIGIGRRV